MIHKHSYTVDLITRYAETDQMGYIHHSVYPVYFEFARIEWFKELDISYKELEKEGILLPVYKMNIKYLVPLTFDEKIKVLVKFVRMRGARLAFEYEIYNEKGLLVTEATVELVFTNKQGKPIRPPKSIVYKLNAK